MDSGLLLMKSRRLLNSALQHMKMRDLDPTQAITCINRAIDIISVCLMLPSDRKPPQDFEECCRRLWGEATPDEMQDRWDSDTGTLWREAQLRMLDRECD